MEFDKNTYKVYTWKNWMYLHYIINPGLAFNELVLGQRVAKVGLVEKNTDKPFIERNYIPCPHCKTLHGYEVWSGKRGFKNWFGLYCPNCRKIIPCIMNATSFILLAATSPLWYPFKNHLKKHWLKMQEMRFKNIGELQPVVMNYDGKNWIAGGLFFGLCMFVLNSLLFPYLFNKNIITEGLGISLAVSLVGGLLFAVFMKWYMKSKKVN